MPPDKLDHLVQHDPLPLGNHPLQHHTTVTHDEGLLCINECIFRFTCRYKNNVNTGKVYIVCKSAEIKGNDI